MRKRRMMREERFGESVFGWALILLIAISFTVSSPASAQNKNENGKGTLSEYQRLEGKWQRPDGGYILELKEIGKDGTLKAAYFNPRPINVFKAEWKRKQDIIKVFVELRDVNYPGSKYNLQYDPKTDRMKGTYYLAVYGETYNIEFVRMK
jgi:hypothetical protein